MTDSQAISMVDLRRHRSEIGDRIDKAVAAVHQHGRYVMGPEVVDLEQSLGERIGVAEVVSCGNGTDALILALLALDIGVGDAVFVPSFSFAATAEAAFLVGATPVFVDVDDKSWCVSKENLVEGLEAAEGAGLKPKALIAVDLFGQPADYDSLVPAVTELEIDLVADAAQSFGASLRGRAVGSLARISTTSFFPTKPLGCYGDGGAIFTNEPEIAERLRSLRTHGSGTHKYEHLRVGMNSRLDTIQAAVLGEKLLTLDDELSNRRKAAERYTSLIGDRLKSQGQLEGAVSAWAQYVVLVEADGREKLRAKLSAAAVETAVHYPRPLHRQPAFAKFPGSGSLEVSEHLASTVLAVPMHPWLRESSQRRVIELLCSS